MASLNSLKITECPAAFAEMAAKHNALCDLIAQLTAQPPLGVTVADRNAVISLDQDALESSLESFIYDTAYQAAQDAVNAGTVDTHINGLITTGLTGYVTSASLTTTLSSYLLTSAFPTQFATEFAAATDTAEYDVCVGNTSSAVTFLVPA